MGVEDADRAVDRRIGRVDLGIVPAAIVGGVAIVGVAEIDLDAVVAGRGRRPPLDGHHVDAGPDRDIRHEIGDVVPGLAAGSEFDPLHLDTGAVGGLVARCVVDSDLDVVFGIRGQIVGILLVSVQEYPNVRIVPGHRFAKLHQKKLAVDKGVGLARDTAGDDDAGIAVLCFRWPFENPPNLAQYAGFARQESGRLPVTGLAAACHGFSPNCIRRPASQAPGDQVSGMKPRA